MPSSLVSQSAAAASVLVALMTPGRARADGGPDQLGAPHQVVVSAEHVAGYVHTSTTAGIGTANDAWLFGNA